MKTEIASVTRANEGIQGISWNILGQTYVPKSVTAHSFSWHATFPPETFVPPHIHPDQDEYLYILEGQLDFMLGAGETQATPGDLVRLPMGIPHGIFNKSGRTAKVLFWVSPTQKLYDLFWAIHNMKEQTPDAVVALAAKILVGCNSVSVLRRPGEDRRITPSARSAPRPVGQITSRFLRPAVKPSAQKYSDFQN
jgi:quercetin dioxygenase-like cupin family protein